MVDTVSAEHQAFLDAFFENRGNVTKAAEACGYSQSYGYILVRKLKDNILEEAKYILAIGATRAAQTLVDGVDSDKPAPASTNRIMCAKEILDRVGIVKQEKLDIHTDSKAPIFILPAKEDVKD